MNMEIQLRRNIKNTSPKFYQSNLQWKKANRNLQNYIYTQNLNSPRFFQHDNSRTENVSNKDTANLAKNIDCFNLKNQINKRVQTLKTNRSSNSAQFFLAKHKSLEKYKSQTKLVNEMIDLGVQTYDQDFVIKKRNLSEQNNCLKELIQILQRQILDYSKKISETEELYYKRNLQKEILNQSLSKLNEEITSLTCKIKKQCQMNKYLQYIIAELNQKITILMGQNNAMSQSLEEYRKNLNKTDKPSQNFTDQSFLSINSEVVPKQFDSFLFKNNETFVQGLQSNILAQESQNWSFSALQMSFNKTPIKIHEAQTNQQDQKSPDQIIQSKYERKIDQILQKHQNEISKLKDKVKYYEIQNLMLKRKKQLFQKNNQQIQQLKQRIQKLSEQNKLIKLMQSKKIKQSSLKNIKETFKQNIHKQKKSLKQPIKIQKLKSSSQSQAKQNIFIKNYEATQTQQTTLNSQIRQNQENAANQKRIARRKGPLQRKFIRKQMRSPSKLEQDLQVSFSLSPQRI